MQLIWVDYAILGIVFISLIISLLRGFVKEALSLASWVIAIIIGLHYMDKLSNILAPKLSSLPPSILGILSFFILLVMTLIITAIVNNLISKLVEKTGLTGTDRAIGMLFGIARGIVVVAVLVLLAGFTAVPQDPWWKESVFIVHFQELALTIASFLPDGLAEKLRF